MEADQLLGFFGQESQLKFYNVTIDASRFIHQVLHGWEIKDWPLSEKEVWK